MTAALWVNVGFFALGVALNPASIMNGLIIRVVVLIFLVKGVRAAKYLEGEPVGDALSDEEPLN